MSLSGSGLEVVVTLSRRRFNRLACSCVLGGLSAAETLAPGTPTAAISSDPLSVARAEREAATGKLMNWRDAYQALQDAAEKCKSRRSLYFGRFGSCQSCTAAIEVAETRGFELCELLFAAETRWLAPPPDSRLIANSNAVRELP